MSFRANTRIALSTKTFILSRRPEALVTEISELLSPDALQCVKRNGYYSVRFILKIAFFGADDVIVNIMTDSKAQSVRRARPG
jgi:hypothetical protein